MSLTPLDVINEPALAIERDDRNLIARDISIILKDPAAAHQVLVHPAPFHFTGFDLFVSGREKHLFERLVGLKILFGITAFFPVKAPEYPYCF